MSDKIRNLREMLEMGEDGKYYVVKIDENDDVVSRHLASIMPENKKKPKTYFKKGDFALMSKLMMKMLMNKRDYNNLTFRLLFALMERIDFNNRIRTFRQIELAEALEAKQPHISASLKVLENDRVIEKRDHDYYFTESFIRYASDRNTFKPVEQGESDEEAN